MHNPAHKILMYMYIRDYIHFVYKEFNHEKTIATMGLFSTFTGKMHYLRSKI